MSKLLLFACLFDMLVCQDAVSAQIYREDELKAKGKDWETQLQKLSGLKKALIFSSIDKNGELKNKLQYIETDEDEDLQIQPAEEMLVEPVILQVIEAYYDLVEDPVVQFETPLVLLSDPTPCELSRQACSFFQTAVRYKWDNDTQSCIPYRLCNFQTFPTEQDCLSQCA